VKFGNWSEISP